MTAPLRRRGPRPLPLHLSLAMLRGLAAAATAPTPDGLTWPPAWPSWNGASPISKAARAEASRIAAVLAAGGHRPEEFRAAVLRRLRRADRGLLAGIAAYRRHPYVRALPDPPAIWTEGGSRLLDFAPPEAVRAAGRASARVTALFVPSLINRSYVLDLAPGRSLLRFLAAQEGIRPLLLDWGWPGEVERGFTLTDYIAGRLERALGAAGREPVVLVGYCMGGLLALAAALRRPDRVRALALLATPWDFHGDAEAERRARSLAALLSGIEPVLEAHGALPVDMLQVLFAMLDPWSVAAKFRSFARLDPASERAALFVALEDWLNDGVPLAAPVARECLGGWYGRNEPGRLLWRVAGAVVDPAAWAGPAFVAIPHRDRIVPPPSARALARRLPHAAMHEAAAGHIGMVAGGGAEEALWKPLLRWMRGL